MVEFIDKSSANAGTPINRQTMMAVQGFQSVETVFKSDGSIEETNGQGHKKITTFNADGSITEAFVGEKQMTKTTTFLANGTVKEVIR
jgi:hypothetical protein